MENNEQKIKQILENLIFGLVSEKPDNPVIDDLTLGKLHDRMAPETWRIHR